MALSVQQAAEACAQVLEHWHTLDGIYSEDHKAFEAVVIDSLDHGVAFGDPTEDVSWLLQYVAALLGDDVMRTIGVDHLSRPIGTGWLNIQTDVFNRYTGNAPLFTVSLPFVEPHNGEDIHRDLLIPVPAPVGTVADLWASDHLGNVLSDDLAYRAKLERSSMVAL